MIRLRRRAGRRWGDLLRLAPWCLSAACSVTAPAQMPEHASPMDFFAPDVRLGTQELAALEARDVVVRTIPSRGPHIGVFAAARAEATGERLVSRVLEIEEFRRGPMVLAVSRFSSPPQPADLEGMELDDGQLEDLRRCRPGNCNLKLGASEIERLQRLMAEAGGHWREAAQEGFRQIVLERTRAFLEKGHAGLPDYADKSSPTDLGETLAELLAQNRFLERSVPGLTQHVLAYPEKRLRGVQSFLYWSKEQIARRPVISVTQVNILRGNPWAGEPEVVIASRQVFALHYLNASMSVTALVRPDPMQGTAYLGYVNRSSVDGVTGFLSTIRRSVVERRIRSETADLFEAMRDRLERP